MKTPCLRYLELCRGYGKIANLEVLTIAAYVKDLVNSIVSATLYCTCPSPIGLNESLDIDIHDKVFVKGHSTDQSQCYNNIVDEFFTRRLFPC